MVLKRYIVLPSVLIMFAALLTACGGGNGNNSNSTAPPNLAAPSNLSYASTSATYSVGMAIPNNTPSNSGGKALSYAVSPALPNGVSLNPSTGVISGMPKSVIASASYVVTAANTIGSTSTTLTIAVNNSAPSNLSYISSSPTYTKGMTIADDIPSNSGGVATSYSVSPTLPTGLTLDPTTGVISGVPTMATTATKYIVTAMNSLGSTTANLHIAVIDANTNVVPSNLSYSITTAIYTVGSTITNNNPNNSGGTVTSYTVSPTLPMGLSLDPNTGVISGKPTSVTAAADYIVTAANAAGKTSVSLNITVNNAALGMLSYSTNPATYSAGIAIVDNTPSVSGGTVTSYVVSPTLPSGLVLNPNTGVISGTPKMASAATAYVVTATNDVGSISATLHITVNTVAPSNLSYSNGSPTYPAESAIPNNTPTINNGGATVTYTVSPALPNGLSLDPSTGVISGIPTTATTAASYTVTATNAVGNTSVTLHIAISAIAPSSLSYSAVSPAYPAGMAISDNKPTVNNGGEAVTYTVAPSVPAGLSLDPSTGIISGTPMSAVATTSYVVTAANTVGSTSTTLQIAVNAVAPSNLSYSVVAPTYPAGAAISNNMPTLKTGGEAVSFSVSPALPSGLSLDPNTGVISGVPTNAATTTNYIVTATNTVGSTSTTLQITVNAVAPSNLSYLTGSPTYSVGTAIPDNTPTISDGGTTLTYSVSPALPLGLSLNTSTGVISGTPTTATAAASYTVTAKNAFGSTSVVLNITINGVAPSNFSYGSNPAVYLVGTAISSDSPMISNGGETVTYAVSPALPAGLNLNTSTGVISGKPTTATSAANYTVTASNSVGSTSVALNITVNNTAPSSLSYVSNPAVYTAGTSISNNIPTINDGGATVTYSVSPTLPAGLALDTSSGVISGKPSTSTAAANYTITASNSIGSTSTVLNITVNAAVPSNLNYSSATAVYTVGTNVTNTPTINDGGATVTYAISPSLPAGLNFDTSSGIISGTPKAASSATNYVVKASNAAGSINVTLSITVNAVAPSNLIYSTTTANYPGGAAISANTPTIDDGGEVVSYTVSPALPVGLSLDPSTGVISGTPTTATGAANYTVTATNTIGSTSATLNITISAVAPSNLVYTTASPSYPADSAIQSNSPYIDDGGATVTYAVSPALPSGLSINSTTGVISGIPQLATDATQYTVSATNSVGSTKAILNITVTAVAPSNLSYASNPAKYTKGTAITGNTPTVTDGGATLTYTVSPALPTGLSIDGGTGIISGTPTAITAAANYTVTATNSVGSTNVSLNIVVNDVPPSNLSYSANRAVYTAGVYIPVNTPTSSGGTVTSYTMSQSLPPGLGLDSYFGTISGIPTSATAGAYYSVTASNTGGYTSDNLYLTVVNGHTLGTQTAIAAGSGFSCALVNGYVWCWGSGADGSLGNGNTLNSTTPVEVVYADRTPLSGVQAVTAGGGHACALVNGTVWCWGLNSSGQLGDGLTTNSDTAVQVVGLDYVQAITAGASHTCALVESGVVCWGYNVDGQLGDNKTTNSSTPVQVIYPDDTILSGVQAIAAGGGFTCALVNGGMQCWGDNNYGELGIGSSTTTYSATPVPVSGLTSGVQAIAAGYQHTCALSNGSVMCWGYNYSGQVGNGSSGSLVPVLAPATVVLASGTALSGVQAITAGSEHTCALVNGGMQCWGDNTYGELGDNTNTNRPNPVAVIDPSTTTTPLSGVQAISSESLTTCAEVNGGMQCWGLNDFGQLGNGSKTDSPLPVAVNYLTHGLQGLALGIGHTCALANGGIQCWGEGGNGQLGNDNYSNSLNPVAVIEPPSVNPINDVQDISGGYAFNCALVNGGVQCWGDDYYGELGDGNTLTTDPAPVQVRDPTNGLPITNVETIATGEDHACAVQNSIVYCWGRNNNGQLGDNLTTDSATLVKVIDASTNNPLTNVQSIAAWGDHTCALVDGGVKCWGDNAYGQLGDNTTTNRTEAVSVIDPATGTPLSNVQAIALGQYHSCALVYGNVWCWGDNADGQLGNNTQTNALEPVEVQDASTNSALFGVQAIVAGDAHTCALVDGGVKCWGSDGFGQLGDNSSNSTSLMAVPVVDADTNAALSGVQAIFAGSDHNCAIANQGVKCWGYNQFGQLGNFSTTTSNEAIDMYETWP